MRRGPHGLGPSLGASWLNRPVKQPTTTIRVQGRELGLTITTNSGTLSTVTAQQLAGALAISDTNRNDRGYQVFQNFVNGAQLFTLNLKAVRDAGLKAAEEP